MKFNPHSPLLTPVTWYRVGRGSKPLPFATPFGNRLFNSIDENQDFILGESYNDRIWTGGAHIFSAAGDGQCQAEPVWSFGVDSGPTSPAVIRDIYGLPICCLDDVCNVRPGEIEYTSNDIFYPPPGVKRVLVIAQGASAEGFAAALDPLTGAYYLCGAPGGGACAMSVIPVVPGLGYPVSFPLDDKAFQGFFGQGMAIFNVDWVLARAGSTPNNPNFATLSAGGRGGQASDCIGDVRFSGGTGGASLTVPNILSIFPNMSGGGGGGEADETGPGTNGADGNGITPALAGNPLGGVGGLYDGVTNTIISAAGSNLLGIPPNGAWGAGIWDNLNLFFVPWFNTFVPGKITIRWPAPPCP
jgi:hypothetical protein